MGPNDGRNEEREDLKFLNTLIEDLRTLERSWRNKSLSKEKVLKHLLEILNSCSSLARTESLEVFDPVYIDFEKYLASVATGPTKLWEGSWDLVAELMNLLCDALREGYAASDRIEELHAHLRNETRASVGENKVTRTQEENTMTDSNRKDPKKLLEDAQEALLSGKGDNAKELALRAAELIAEAEAEEARKKQESLTADLEKLKSEESEAEIFLSETKERTAELEQELGAFNKRLSDAQSAFDKREKEYQEIKQEIEKTEAEMASLKSTLGQLRERFEEALPARDAAKRECSKIESEAGELPSEVEMLRENVLETEERLEGIRQRKSEIDAELKKLSEKTAM